MFCEVTPLLLFPIFLKLRIKPIEKRKARYGREIHFLLIDRRHYPRKRNAIPFTASGNVIADGRDS